MQTLIDTSREAQKRRGVLLLAAMRIAANAPDEPEQTGNMSVADATKDSLRRFVLHALRAQTEVNMVTAAIALERFRLAHHTYPDALAKLTPGFLSTVPVDCMDGHDLRYRLNPDGSFLLYSVGEDGVDNGGDPTPREGGSPSFAAGKDMVWPRPATAGEMRIYEAEQSRRK